MLLHKNYPQKAKIPYKTSIKIWRILNEEYKG